MATYSTAEASPKLTLTYFPVRGIAEVARMILKHKEVEFVDERLTQKEWDTRKSLSPYGFMPYLTLEDGTVIGGSIPIYTYLIAKYGLGGKNVVEDCLLMSAVDCMKEIWNKIPPYSQQTDPARKEELRTQVLDMCKTKLPFLEAKVANGHLEGVSGDGLVNYSEFWVMQIFDQIKLIEPSFGEDYPKLKSIADNVRALPNIAKWLRERPTSAF